MYIPCIFSIAVLGQYWNTMTQNSKDVKEAEAEPKEVCVGDAEVMGKAKIETE
jgi:hypothetical protein